MGARYYDPQVGRFISRDAVLSEHPYLYCEHEPVNAVDPSGRWKLREWAEKTWEQVKEHGRELWKWYERAEYARDLVDLLSSWQVARIGADCSRSMRKMIDEWDPRNAEVDPYVWYDVWRSHLRQAIGDVNETAGDSARFYYRYFYPPKNPF